MRFLLRRIRLGNQWPRLAQPKTELAEQSLALTHTELNGVLLLDPCRQSFAVP